MQLNVGQKSSAEKRNQVFVILSENIFECTLCNHDRLANIS